MSAFRFSSAAIDTAMLRAELADPGCGAYAAFEGWVRDHNEGQRVTRLEYEAYAPLAAREGEQVIAEAIARFGLRRALCVHRIGALALGEIAVWVGAAAPHRDEAFRACRYIIDEVKHRLPIWKKEHYASGNSGWVNCERCGAAADAGADAASNAAHETHGHGHAHGPRR
jgi:molybdopterin synthase catalytic subunit